MADIVWQDVVDVAADLATGVSAGGQAKILAHVNRVVDPGCFGGLDSPTYTLARAYLAAHYGALAKALTAGRGPVSSTSEGGVSISYLNLHPANSSLLGTTVWGRAFLGLVYSSPKARAGFVAAPVRGRFP